MVVNLIIPVAFKAAAEAAVHQLSPESQGESLVIRLSATGQEPATHVACQPIVTLATYAALQAMQASGQFGSVALAVASGELLESFDQLASQNGLARIAREKP